MDTNGIAGALAHLGEIMKMSQFVETCRSALVVLGVTVCTYWVTGSPIIVTESSIGEFSDSSTSPTLIASTLEVGTNLISGKVDSHSFGMDDDFFKPTLPDNCHLAELVVRISSYTASLASGGSFNLMPSEQGNSGYLYVIGDSVAEIAYTVGAPTNLVFHFVAPYILQLGGSASYNYEVELVVAPNELVAGTQIHSAVEVSFPSELGSVYQLQCSADLMNDQWLNLGQTIVGTGEEMSTFDTTRRAQQMFYRVVKQ